MTFPMIISVSDRSEINSMRRILRLTHSKMKITRIGNNARVFYAVIYKGKIPSLNALRVLAKAQGILESYIRS